MKEKLLTARLPRTDDETSLQSERAFDVSRIRHFDISPLVQSDSNHIAALSLKGAQCLVTLVVALF